MNEISRPNYADYKSESLKTLRVKYLEELNPEDQRVLRRKVEYRDGVIDVLVKPFSGEYKKMDANTSMAYKDYAGRRNEFIKLSMRMEEFPIVILDDRPMSSLLEKIDLRQGTVYAVSTLPGDARPDSLTDTGAHLLFGAESQAWNRVIKPLKKAGVKVAVIGGEQMVLHKSKDKEGEQKFKHFKNAAKGMKNAMNLVNEGVFLDDAPGQVALKMLSSGIDVAISRITFPSTPFRGLILHY